ncbi:MAG: WbqC family protein [Oligoflexia bacterium]|nr:WbqC family protein [Oligoflexia bacterium]
MIASIQQPHYFPWIGYFEQISNSDHFIFLDTVQWIKQGRQHRAKITPPKSRSSSAFYLTIPIQSKNHRDKPFHEIKIDDQQNWQKHHWSTIQSIYGKAPYFHTQLEPICKNFFEKSRNKTFLIDLCTESIYSLWDALQLSASIHYATDYELIEPKARPDKNLRLINLCNCVSASTYYSTIGSARYMNLELFRENGIRVQQQNLRHPQILDRPLDISIIDWIAHLEFSKIIYLLNYRKQLMTNSTNVTNDKIIYNK